VNVLRRQPQGGECALAVEADDEPRYLAVAEVKQSRPFPVICVTSTPLALPRPHSPAMGHADQPCPGSGRRWARRRRALFGSPRARKEAARSLGNLKQLLETENRVR